MVIFLCYLKVQVPKNDPETSRCIFLPKSKIGKIEITRVLLKLSTREIQKNCSFFNKDWFKWLYHYVIERFRYGKMTQKLKDVFFFTKSKNRKIEISRVLLKLSTRELHEIVAFLTRINLNLSLIHIWRCRRSTLCRSRWSPYH